MAAERSSLLIDDKPARSAPDADATASTAGDGKVIFQYARTAGLCALFFLVYLVLNRLSYVDAIRPFAVMAWHPALGVSVAIVARWGRPALPLVFIAPFLGALLIRGFPLTPFYTCFGAILAVFKAYLIWRIGAHISKYGSDSILSNLQAGLLLATIPVTLVASSIHSVTLAAFGVMTPEQIRPTVERLWIGDLIGIFVQLPFCLLVLDTVQNWSRRKPKISQQTAWQIFVTAATLWLIFFHYRNQSGLYFYILFLPMIWVVLTHGLTGAIVLNMAVQASTVSYLLSVAPDHIDVTLFQALTAIFIVSALTLGFSIDQNRRAAKRLREQEQELAATLKTAATSELAGTLAHELSHPVGAIANYAIVIEDLIRDSDPQTRAIFGKLRQEARRAKDTLHRMREFYRSGTMVMERINLPDTVRDAISLVSTRMGTDDVSIKCVIVDDINLTADRVQLHGVLHNVLINALDAMKGKSSPRKNVLLTVWGANGSAHVTIEDSGTGIAPDVRDHIFEPLVTTKKDGLGLGLSTSRSIIQAHGGRIECSASALGGAKFHISLPLDT